MAAALSLIKRLYRAATHQEQVVDDHAERLEIFEQADAFIDMERLTDTTMEQETEQLAAAHGILDELHARLSKAINSWSESTEEEMTQEELFAALLAEVSSDEVPPKPEHERERESPPNIHDPTVGTFSKYTREWHAWTKSPTIDQLPPATPTRWWMEEETHYGLCQPQEQGQLESSAQAARCNRVPPSRLPVPVHCHQMTFAQQVSYTRKQYHHSAVPLPLSFNHNLSHSRPARRCSEDFWDDDEYDPDFWQKNLRPGNIWVDIPRYPIPDEDNLSPRTVPSGVGMDSARQASPDVRRVKSYAVGSTDPAAYFTRSWVSRRC